MHQQACMPACSQSLSRLHAALLLLLLLQTVEHVVLVQVPDDEETPQAHGRPPLPRPPAPRPPTRPQGTAIAINSSAARRSQYHYAAVGNDDDDSALYGRSLAFVPTSPALPAPFR
jgi:hypothetical protein